MPTMLYCRRYIGLGGKMWCWRPPQIWPHQDWDDALAPPSSILTWWLWCYVLPHYSNGQLSRSQCYIGSIIFIHKFFHFASDWDGRSKWDNETGVVSCHLSSLFSLEVHLAWSSLACYHLLKVKNEVESIILLNISILRRLLGNITLALRRCVGFVRCTMVAEEHAILALVAV